MRYTTVIDISDIPAIYKNPNARLVYLHLALKSGYHDDDRDLIEISIRRLAMATGLTVSATRHSIAQLERACLLVKEGPFWHVKKWIVESTVTPRAKTAKQQKAIELEAQRRLEQEQREREQAIEDQRRKQLAAQGKTSFMIYYEGLVERAKAGDTEAARLVAKNKRQYEAHKEANKIK